MLEVEACDLAINNAGSRSFSRCALSSNANAKPKRYVTLKKIVKKKISAANGDLVKPVLKSSRNSSQPLGLKDFIAKGAITFEPKAACKSSRLTRCDCLFFWSLDKVH